MAIMAQNVNKKLRYKLTEVGVIPEDWEAKQIRDVCSLINGRGFKPHEWQTIGLPIIRIQNLNGSEDFNYFSGPYNPKILIEHGQLLFAWSGSRGTSFGPYVWNGGLALLNYHTWKVVINESRTNPHFLFHALRQLTGYIETKAHGASALVHVQKWEMEKFLIPLPSSLLEQHAIATALSDIDALITSLDHLIAKKRDIKQATMQQLLTGKRRLPGFSEKWEVQILGEIAEIIDPHPSHRAPAENDDGIPFVGIGDISTDGKINHQTSRIVSEIIFQQHNERYKLEDGLIGIGRVASIGKVVRLLPNIGNFVVSPTIAVIKPQKIDINLLFYCLTSKEVKEQFDRISNGSTRQSVGMNVLRDIQLFLPKSLAEQQAIATVLSDMDAEIAALEQKREKTHMLKQGMMQELLTGKTRLI